MGRVAPACQPSGKIGGRWTRAASTNLAAIQATEKAALNRMHEAINEKKAEVAAKLLAAMPDD